MKLSLVLFFSCSLLNLLSNQYLILDSSHSVLKAATQLSFQLKSSKKSKVCRQTQWTDSRADRANLKISRQFQFSRYCWKLTTWVCRTWPVVSSLDRNKSMHRSISQPLMIKIRISTCHHILYFIWSILGKYVHENEGYLI